MILRTRCPSCSVIYRLKEPLPPPGKKYRCSCGTVITIAYPDEVVETLRAQGIVPQEEADAAESSDEHPESEDSTATLPPEPPQAPVAEPQVQGEDQAAPEQASGDSSPPPPGADDGLGLDSTPSGPPIGLTAPPEVPPLPEQQPLQRYDLDAPTLKMEPLGSLRQPPAAAAEEPRKEAFDDEPTVVDDPSLWAPSVPQEPDPILRGGGRDSLSERDPLFIPAAETPAASEPPPGDRKRKRKRKGKAKAKASGSSAAPPAGWMRRFLRGRFVRYTVLSGLFLVVAGALTGGYFYLQFSKALEEAGLSVDQLEVYEPPTVTIVRDPHGVAIGEFFEHQRYVVPLEQIPKHVQDAFVSAEDASFWEHSGLDYIGIVRAMMRNVQERRMAQGASTITQQVARSFLLTREKKLERKIKEAILARRIEKHFEKEHILYLYLNQIFLGHGAYGVQAAARLYFDKDVSELSLAEGAIIAGLPQAPSNYSPNRNFPAARQRQRYVLDQMAAKGHITSEEADTAYDTPLLFSKKRDRNLDHAPYYVEPVRRYLVQTYGHDAVYNQGLQVILPIDLELQAAANEAVQVGVRRSDKIIGYRGALEQHTTPVAQSAARHAIDRKRTLTLRPYDPAFELPEGPVNPTVVPALREGELTRGVVARVERRWALVDVGLHRTMLPVSEFSWCHNVSPEVSFRYFSCKTLDDVLAEGDEIEVRVVSVSEDFKESLGRDWEGSTFYPRIAMEQPPLPEAALMSMRVTDGAILAMVGGSDYSDSEFNRATQAKRQVGSTFKPLVYAAALAHEDAGFHPSSILVDAPIVEESRGEAGDVWTPGNAGGKYLGDTTFRRGLILSRNIVTLKILQRIGVRYMIDYVNRYGFTSELPQDLSLGLGTASVSLHEMLQAYSVFATLGSRQSSYFITEVRDRHGNVLESTRAGERQADVMDPETAYIMVNLMQDVVRAGTARKALSLGVPLAGKTGTTNAFRDAWFMGYTPELITAVWLGLDDFKTMGRDQYGGDVALPIFVEFMEPALESYPPTEYEKPEGVVFLKVDPNTGLLAREGEPSVRVPFLKTRQPTAYTPQAGAVDEASFLSGEY